ncbi:MAG: prenyltransferase/squalene oxidase repeat-containing protein, partial [Anaerolineales bacterium]
GILGNQYMPYYHGAILELLVKAGYGDDTRLVRGLDWLLTVRQEDGGWVVPAQLVPAREKTSQLWLGPALPPDRSKPSSHLATGMTLRAFVAHPAYRGRSDVL